MINAVSQVNSIPSKVVHFSGDVSEKTEQENIKPSSQKILLGLGALAAIAIGGLLIKKGLNTNEISDAASDIAKQVKATLKRPKEFMTQSFQDVGRELRNVAKLETGDKIVVVPKTFVKESGADTKELFSKAMEGMSDRGFITVVQKSNKDIDPATIRAFDPENLGSGKFVDSIKKYIADRRILAFKISNASNIDQIDKAVDDLWQQVLNKK